MIPVLVKEIGIKFKKKKKTKFQFCLRMPNTDIAEYCRILMIPFSEIFNIFLSYIDKYKIKIIFLWS